MKFTNITIGITAMVALGLLSSGLSQTSWTQTELKTLTSLSLSKLGSLPKDPSNAVADNEKAAVLGQKLFFDTHLSSNGEVACSTCHSPEKYFADDRARSEGIGRTGRKAPSIVGTAFNQFYFWDGRADSQWAQALGPLESAVEHGGDRTQYAHLIFKSYKSEYEALFGPMPDLSNVAQFPNHAGPVANSKSNTLWNSMTSENREAVTRVFVNIGKSIAAYERKLNPGRSRFDVFVKSLLNQEDVLTDATLSPDEEAGLRLFIGKANCVACHNGALFTDQQFHNTGVPTAEGLKLDLGRDEGLLKLFASEFTCRSAYSDAAPELCTVITRGTPDRYETSVAEKSLKAAFKTPSLRGIQLHAPFMHAGQFKTIGQVLAHYNIAPESPVGKTELTRLNLSDSEMKQLEAFLKTLQAPIKADAVWLQDPFMK